MWFEESVFYQIYPLGLTGAPHENPGEGTEPVPRLRALLSTEAAGTDWPTHIRKLGADAVYFSPVFESDTHGYNTRDFRLIDRRLGTNADFADVVQDFHAHGIRVVIDAVFNHVGRGFWAFRDVQEKRWDSPYKDWFRISFDGNSNYNDGFWYEGWEGHYDLVKLNLQNQDVRNYLLDTVRFWVKEFDIDGLRLDVAYSLDFDFMKQLRQLANALSHERYEAARQAAGPAADIPDTTFFLLGETLHGDYNRWVNDEMLMSCTNYECYKGLWSSLNSRNLFEIVHSLKRQFGPEPWTLYKGKHLFNFCDNHDVTRAASILTEPGHLPVLYGLLFGMPGIPCVYYGSEWGEKASKQAGGDWNLRPALDHPEWNDLTDWIAALAAARRKSPALCYGDFRDLLITNLQTVFQREVWNFAGIPEGHERVLVAVNADDKPFFAHFQAGTEKAVDLITGKGYSLHDGIEIPAFGVIYLKA